MSKRNVAFIKPEEPSFIKKLKQQINYQEGPTVDTKREKHLAEEDNDNDSDSDKNSDEKFVEEEPVVVVLKEGDLTVEEVQLERKRIQEEEASKPADLSQKVIFRPTTKKNNKVATTAAEESIDRVNKTLLSFPDEEEENENY